MQFAVCVSVLQSTFMELLSEHVVRERERERDRERQRERVDAILDLVPLDEALR